ncbi:MAG: tyrosine-type recombinase/integrase [Nitrospirota bacterium]
MIYKRGAVWWIKLRWEGQVIRKSTGEKVKEKARSVERNLLKELALVEQKPLPFFKPEPANAEEASFKDVWEKYMSEEATLNAPGTFERAKQCAKNFLPLIGDLKLSAITPSVLNQYKVKRLKDGVCLATVAKELKFVQRVFSLCKREWELLEHSPFERFEVPAVNNELTRYLQPGQLEKLLTAAPEWLRPIIQVARLTGIRRGNLAALTWQQVDLTHKTLFLGQTKNGDPLLVPLVDEAFGTFKALHKSKSSCPFVFHMEGKQLLPEQISQAFIRTCKKADITNFRFHDLRHDFATRLVKKGVELYRVGKLLAHRTVTMTKRYAHLNIDDLRDAVSVLNNRGGCEAKPGKGLQSDISVEASVSRVCVGGGTIGAQFGAQ